MVAYGALLAWPAITLVMMLAMPARMAVIWSLVAGYLLLPVELASFDFKGVPSLDKTSIPNLATFVLALLLGGRGFKWPRSKTVNLLMFCFILSPFLTSLANLDPIITGDAYTAPMDLYTAFSLAAYNAIALLPFILGAAMLRDESSHRDILTVFALCGLAYSVPVLAEIRLSPFLQGRLYNLGTAEFFFQQMRNGGFRSMVFLGHGLLVSAFLGLSIVAATGLWRAHRTIWFAPAGLCVAYLFVVLLLNKSVGPTVLAVLMIGMLSFLRPRRLLSISFVIAAMVMTYPFLRANHLIPVEKITAMAESVSKDRAESADFRFRNEEALLRRANDRPLLGWGAFGRNRILTLGGDRASDVSVTDGAWIIALGQFGWFGYLSLFGLLCYPLWNMFRERKRITSPIIAALAAMLVFSLLDLVPNNSLRPITWLIAGALSGLAVAQPRPARTRLAPQALDPREPQPAAV